MVRKLMLGICLAAIVLLVPSTAIARSMPAAPRQAPANIVLNATESNGGGSFLFQCASVSANCNPDTPCPSDVSVPATTQCPTVTVTVGETITFNNTGAAPHTATAENTSFDSGNLDPGATYTTPPFSAAGSIPFVCSYHKALGMAGTIVVVAAGGTVPPATTTTPSPTAPAASPSPNSSPTPAASPSPLAAGLPTPAPPPTAPPSQKYFPKIGGALLVLLVIGVLVGYYKTTRKLADKD